MWKDVQIKKKTAYGDPLTYHSKHKGATRDHPKDKKMMFYGWFLEGSYQFSESGWYNTHTLEGFDGLMGARNIRSCLSPPPALRIWIFYLGKEM